MTSFIENTKTADLSKHAPLFATSFPHEQARSRARDHQETKQTSFSHSFATSRRFLHIVFVQAKERHTNPSCSNDRTMKLSIATASLLVVSTAAPAAAFQQPSTRRAVASTSSNKSTSSFDPLNALAMDQETMKPSNPFEKKKEEEEKMDMTGIAFSGLQGKALEWTNDDFPEARELRAVIPADCFEPDTATSLGYLSVSVIGTALCTFVGANMLSVLPPENLLTAPFWLLYSAVTGTVAMGLWVLAHECGHGAFSKNKTIQDTVGYVLHSLFLVPYYSWQRSHAVHHQYTNHMELGETHVPETVAGDSLEYRQNLIDQFGTTLGIRLWGGLQSFLHLIIGWPAYLLIGATGGSARGMTNHYWPDPLTMPDQPKKELFPGNWKEKVFKSDVGVAAVFAGALAWAACNGLPQMMAIYGGPLIVVNAWLVLYTWYVYPMLFTLLVWRCLSGLTHVMLLIFVISPLRLFTSLTGFNTRMSMFLTFPPTTTTLSRALCIPSIVPTTNWIHGGSLTFCTTRLVPHMLRITLIPPFLTTRQKEPPTPSKKNSL